MALMKKKTKRMNRERTTSELPAEERVPNKFYFNFDEADLSESDFKNNTLDITETDDDEDEGIGDGNLSADASDDNPLPK
jgi:hypothetical protein